MTCIEMRVTNKKVGGGAPEETSAGPGLDYIPLCSPPYGGAKRSAGLPPDNQGASITCIETRVTNNKVGGGAYWKERRAGIPPISSPPALDHIPLYSTLYGGVKREGRVGPALSLLSLLLPKVHKARLFLRRSRTLIACVAAFEICEDRRREREREVF